MDLIAEKGIAAHYSGRGAVSGMVGHGLSGGRSSKTKTICLNNTDIALRVIQSYGSNINVLHPNTFATGVFLVFS